MKHILTALRMFLLLTLLTGVAYPALMLYTGKALFPEQAGGSLIFENKPGGGRGKVIGSALIAQQFTEARYFHPRPSATSYATLPSGASNLSPASKALTQAVTERASAGESGSMLFASASGLDPDISPPDARAQIPRILAARGVKSGSAGTSRIAIEALVKQLTQPPTFGVLGRERINVLRLNLALEALETDNGQ